MMADNDKYNQLILKIIKLMNLYSQILNQSVEIGNELNNFYDEGMDVDLYDFFENPEDVKLFIRLMNVLAYVALPEEQEVVNNLMLNVLENNLDFVNSDQDLLNLLNYDELFVSLLKKGKIDIEYETYLNDMDDNCLDDNYEEEYEITPKKRLLN